MKVFEAQIEINAPVDVVWTHLTDFSGYPAWNPYILWAKGDLEVGSIVRFKVTGQLMPFTAPITSLVENEALIWEARTPIPGLKPRYIRRLEAISSDCTRFINREEFTGWSVPFASPLMNYQLKPLFPKTCAALKQRVEASSG